MFVYTIQFTQEGYTDLCVNIVHPGYMDLFLITRGACLTEGMPKPKKKPKDHEQETVVQLAKKVSRKHFNTVLGTSGLNDYIFIDGIKDNNYEAIVESQNMPKHVKISYHQNNNLQKEH